MVNVNNLRRRNEIAQNSGDGRTGISDNAMQIMEAINAKKGSTISADFVRREIVKFFRKSEADGIDSSFFKLSLLDPLSRKRIRTPARSSECEHFQCFDLYNFLTFNLQNNGGNGEGKEKNKNAWRCPHCQKEAKREQLRIDGFFQEILLKVGPEPLEVELLPDGNFREVEQLDFKEVLLNSIEDEEIVAIVPRKKAKTVAEKPVETPQTSNSSSIVPENSVNNEKPVPVDDLCELLGIAPGDDILEAVQKLKRQAKATEVYYSYTLNQLREILGVGAKECVSIIDAVRKLKQKASIVDRLQQFLETTGNDDEGTETENSLFETILKLKNGAETGKQIINSSKTCEKSPEKAPKTQLTTEKPKLTTDKTPNINIQNVEKPSGVQQQQKTQEFRHWVDICWKGKPSNGWVSPFLRGQKRPSQEVRDMFRRRFGINYEFDVCLNPEFAQVALRSKKDADLVIEGLNGHTFFGCILRLKLSSVDRVTFLQTPQNAGNKNGSSSSHVDQSHSDNGDEVSILAHLHPPVPFSSYGFGEKLVDNIRESGSRGVGIGSSTNPTSKATSKKPLSEPAKEGAKEEALFVEFTYVGKPIGGWPFFLAEKSPNQFIIKSLLKKLRKQFGFCGVGQPLISYESVWIKFASAKQAENIVKVSDGEAYCGCRIRATSRTEKEKNEKTNRSVQPIPEQPTASSANNNKNAAAALPLLSPTRTPAPFSSRGFGEPLLPQSQAQQNNGFGDATAKEKIVNAGEEQKTEEDEEVEIVGEVINGKEVEEGEILDVRPPPPPLPIPPPQKPQEKQQQHIGLLGPPPTFDLDLRMPDFARHPPPLPPIGLPHFPVSSSSSLPQRPLLFGNGFSSDNRNNQINPSSFSSFNTHHPGGNNHPLSLLEQRPLLPLPTPPPIPPPPPPPPASLLLSVPSSTTTSVNNPYHQHQQHQNPQQQNKQHFPILSSILQPAGGSSGYHPGGAPPLPPTKTIVVEKRNENGEFPAVPAQRSGGWFFH